MTFSTSVIPHPDAQGDWLPIFRSSRAPQVSRQGELTFSIERDASTSRLLEDESRRFQVMVILKDDGGTQDGGSDTSAPAHVDVVMIGTPQTVRFVRSVIDAPRALLVTWLFSDEASQANSKSNHEAPGKVTSFIVELRCWTGYGQLITEHESAVNFPADSTRGSVLFEDLDLAKEYVPVVSACNRLVCSNTQSGASSFALDVPSGPERIQIRRRSRTEVVISWPLPVDKGDGTPYTNEQPSIPLGFRLKIFSASSGEDAIVTESSLDWADHVVIDADHDGSIFSEEHAGDMLQLSVSFVNQVGNSLVEHADFVLGEIDCEVVCGDSVRASSEGCDDGNLVAGDGCSEACTIEPSYFCHEISHADFSCLPALYGKSECKQPAFDILRIEPETDLAGADNCFLVSFLANFDILPDRDILLRGLTGSGTSSISLAAEEFDSGTHRLFKQPSRWDQHHGILKFQLLWMVPANTLVVFSFTLRNPSISQLAQKVAIHCEDCCANSPALLVASAEQPSAALGVQHVDPACSHVNVTHLAMGMKDRPISEPTGVYGSACDKICFGLVQGDLCKCERNFFGEDCSLYVEADPARSISQVVQAGEAMTLGSFTVTRRGVDLADHDHRMEQKAASHLHERRSTHEEGTQFSLTIPQGAFTETTLVRANVFPVVAAVPGTQSQLTARAEVVELRPHGIIFAKPVTVHLRTSMLVTSEQLQQLQLDIMFYDDMMATWMPANGTTWRVEGSSLHVSAHTMHFSQWSIFSRERPSETGMGNAGASISTPAPSAPSASPDNTSTGDVLPSGKGNNMAATVGIGLGIASAGLMLIFIIVMLLRRRKAQAWKRAIDDELKRRHEQEEEEEAERKAEAEQMRTSEEKAMDVLQEKSAVVSADYVYTKSGELREVPVDDVQSGKPTHNDPDTLSAQENTRQPWKLPHVSGVEDPFMLIPAPPSPSTAAAERELNERRSRKEERRKLRELRSSRRGTQDSSRPGTDRSQNRHRPQTSYRSADEDPEVRMEHKLKDLIRASLKGIAQVCALCCILVRGTEARVGLSARMCVSPVQSMSACCMRMVDEIMIYIYIYIERERERERERGMHACMHVCMYACMHVCMHACMYVGIYPSHATEILRRSQRRIP